MSGGSGGLGLGTVLFLIFLVLKLTGHIDWSWWWVTAPLWVSFIFFLIFLGLFLVGLGRVRNRINREWERW